MTFQPLENDVKLSFLVCQHLFDACFIQVNRSEPERNHACLTCKVFHNLFMTHRSNSYPRSIRQVSIERLLTKYRKRHATDRRRQITFRYNFQISVFFHCRRRRTRCEYFQSWTTLCDAVHVVAPGPSPSIGTVFPLLLFGFAHCFPTDSPLLDVALATGTTGC